MPPARRCDADRGQARRHRCRRLRRLYLKACGAPPIGQNRYKIGDTIFAPFRDPGASRAVKKPFANPLEAVKEMAALGIRYVTIQVRNCDDAFKQLTAGGANEAVAPVNFGTVARIAFVRDPDRNFVELGSVPRLEVLSRFALDDSRANRD